MGLNKLYHNQDAEQLLGLLMLERKNNMEMMGGHSWMRPIYKRENKSH